MIEKLGKNCNSDCQYTSDTESMKEGIMDMGDKLSLEKPKLLMHSCCGPCSTVCIERLYKDYDISIYFYNPNITDPEEYEKRKEGQIKLIESFNADPSYDGRVDFIEGPYEPETFFEVAKGMENEKEGGKRCIACFNLRLEKTAEIARMNKFDYFTTTLTVSPHKDYDNISSIGKKLGMQYGVSYLDMNFKKKDGYKRSVELSNKYGLYRQNYCGCSFSDWRDDTGNPDDIDE